MEVEGAVELAVVLPPPVGGMVVVAMEVVVLEVEGAVELAVVLVVVLVPKAVKLTLSVIAPESAPRPSELLKPSTAME